MTHYREIPPNKILKFPATPGFKGWKHFFSSESVSHPAKMNLHLLRHILRTYTKKRDVVLDPMAGCYDSETEVLTIDGWKYFKDITFEDKVATLNQNTGFLEYQRPTNIINERYSGQMYKIKTKTIDLLVTPDHWMYVAVRKATKQKKKWGFKRVQAKEIFGKHILYKKDLKWSGQEPSFFIIPSCSTPMNNYNYKAVKVPIQLWMRFLGFWLSEGSVTKSGGRYYVTIHTDIKDKHRNEMYSVVEEVAQLLNRKTRIDKRGRIGFNDKRLYELLNPLGHATSKYIPKYIKNHSSTLLSILLESLVKGDGHKKRGGSTYYTSSIKLANDVQEISLKAGYVANVSISKEKGYQSVIEGRVITASENGYAIYITSRCKTPRVYLKRNLWDAKRKGTITNCFEGWTSYNGRIFCVEVPNHIIYVRRNGYGVWCGNTGSTVVLAGAMGRHGIAVEYEPKFCRMIEENIGRTEKYHTFTPGGKMTCIQGDARELSKHLIESDVIISSPPYGNRLADVAVQDGDPARMGYRQAVDVVLTSPLYGNIDIASDDPERVRRIQEAIKRGDKISGRSIRWLNNKLKGVQERTGFDLDGKYSQDKDNVGNLKYGKIDSIVTSPPYGSDNANLQAREDKSAKSVLESTGVRAVQLEPDNLGNLKYGEIDAVITSPPYEAGPFNHAGGHGGAYAGGIAQRDPKLKPVDIHEDNIGSLKGETYLEAMIRVYRESYKVLKPLGKIVLVTKNFIRNKSVVRLDLDTIKLCESVGFKLIDHLYFKLPTKSFWKILYHKKYPDVAEVLYEDVLVFEKPAL